MCGSVPCLRCGRAAARLCYRAVDLPRGLRFAAPTRAACGVPAKQPGAGRVAPFPGVGGGSSPHPVLGSGLDAGSASGRRAGKELAWPPALPGPVSISVVLVCAGLFASVAWPCGRVLPMGRLVVEGVGGSGDRRTIFSTWARPRFPRPVVLGARSLPQRGAASPTLPPRPQATSWTDGATLLRLPTPPATSTFLQACLASWWSFWDL